MKVKLEFEVFTTFRNLGSAEKNERAIRHLKKYLVNILKEHGSFGPLSDNDADGATGKLEAKATNWIITKK